MAKIKATDTKPESILRKRLWAMGYRYRKNYKKLPGKPDIVFVSKKVAVFIDGEFWHGYNWEQKVIHSNQAYWIPKIERNMARDKAVNETLADSGWYVIRFWSSEVKKNIDQCIEQIVQALLRHGS